MEFWSMVRKEFLVEWKQKYALYGLLLYALTMVFTVSLLLAGKTEPETWNVIFWILILFVAVNAVARSFMNESRGQMLYLYQLAGAGTILGAKLIFNLSVLMAAGLLTFLFFQFFSAETIHDLPMFLTGILAGCAGLACNLTLVSSVSSGAHNKVTLFAVLSFPLTIPLLLASIRLTGNAMEGLPRAESGDELVFLGGFIGIVSAVSFILFPALWRE